MKQKPKKSSTQWIQSVSRISGIWLFVILWWGLTALSPMQIHNQIIIHDIPYICVGLVLCFLIGCWQKWTLSFQFEKKAWIIPLLFLMTLDVATIFYFKHISLSFILTTACVFMISDLLDIKSGAQAGYLLFLSSLGLGVTHMIMYLFRGRPAAGSGFFAHQISFLLNLFGKHADVINGTLFFQGKKITCDLMKMGFFPWLAFALSFFAFIVIAKGSFKRKIYVMIGSIFIHYLYLIGRFSFISLFIPNIMFAGLDPFNLFYWRTAIISFVLLILVWFFILHESNLVETNNHEYRLSSSKRIKKNYWLFSIIVVSVLLLTLCFLFHGITKHRDIHLIIDEIHSDWESTLIDFSQNISGTLAENSYHSFLDYIRHFYPVTVMTNKPVMDSLLKGVELFHTPIINSDILNALEAKYPELHPVLMLKCITTPFSYEEIEILKDFVYKGGSVFLVGDHTDVFFMNKNLNELAQYFGIRFEQNSVYFIDGGWVINDSPDYKIHPVTQYLEKFIWATGDSLKISSPAFPLIYSSHVCFSDEVNYFYDNFFGNTRIDADEVFGSYCMMAGARYGKGKVIAFTDSTCFNNYLIFSVGRRELLAGILRWLADRGNTNPFPLLTYIFFCFLGVVLIKRWPGIDSFIYLGIIGVTVGWLIGYVLSLSLNGAIYPKPKPIFPLPEKVVIDAAHDPLHSLSFGNSESFLSPTSYDSLLFNIGRIDIFSRILYRGTITQKELDGSSCLIMASPTKNYSEQEKNNIKYYVNEGGSLLLIEGANPNSTINQIAQLFGLYFRLDPSRNKVEEMKVQMVRKNRESLKINPAWIDGGTSIFEYDKMPIVCFKREGKGFIMAMGDDGLFMKENSLAYEKEIMDLQCNMIKALLDKDAKLLESMEWNDLYNIPQNPH